MIFTIEYTAIANTNPTAPNSSAPISVTNITTSGRSFTNFGRITGWVKKLSASWAITNVKNANAAVLESISR